MTLKELFRISSWWGKIIGLFLGYISMGPLGALFGLIIGNFFDKGLMSHFTNPHFLYHSEKRDITQKIFFETTFAAMGRIAKADGRVSQKELEMARQMMDEMRLNKQQKEFAKKLFNEGKEPTFRLDLRLQELRRVCLNKRELLKLFVDIQYRAAQVDGLSVNKIKALNTIFSILGFAPLYQQHRFYEGFTTHESNANEQSSQQYYYKTASSSSPSLEHAYALLDISAAATKNEVKRAYRKLLSKNHPDKLIAQGLPEAMIKMANEKTHQIRKAYELICGRKGWK